MQKESRRISKEGDVLDEWTILSNIDSSEQTTTNEWKKEMVEIKKMFHKIQESLDEKKVSDTTSSIEKVVGDVRDFLRVSMHCMANKENDIQSKMFQLEEMMERISTSIDRIEANNVSMQKFEDSIISKLKTMLQPERKSLSDSDYILLEESERIINMLRQENKKKDEIIAGLEEKNGNMFRELNKLRWKSIVEMNRNIRKNIPVPFVPYNIGGVLRS